ncbi:MAG TPA: DUF1553 domain-containing protein, partial [Pirellulaceae bacterium]|nr:DUF1553 domain-containing protein [Pirellulaceae bacterium]
LQLVLDEGRPQFSLIHFWPGDALRVQAREPLALNRWTHLAVTYDGSSRAAGVSLYVDGRRVPTEVVRDNLTRDFAHRGEWGDSSPGGVEPALGARFRDVGFRGGAIDELRVFDRRLTALEVAVVMLQPDREPAAAVPDALAARLTAASQEERFEHFRLRFDEAYQAQLKALKDLRKAEDDAITQVRQVMVLKEATVPRPTRVLKRGAYDAPGDVVEPGTPASIFPMPADLPRNRLGLARWMIDSRNPLVSRVAVNRFWYLLFGRGIVSSLEDFGSQGQPPTHPELLDWLARDFMASDWNVKRLCKQLVLSATYRQSSTPSDLNIYETDPDNLLLARGPRYRLAAEQIRDNALAASGLLAPTIGGPSVMPYQPAGLWEESGTGKSYRQSKGEGLYRRSLYTFWRRTSPPPSMTTFDAPGRETCRVRRERTNTPLQALVLLNDPQYVEASRVLAEKLLRDAVPGMAKEAAGGGASERDQLERRIVAAFRLATSVSPTAKQLDVLVRLHDEQWKHFASAKADAEALVSVGEAPRDKSLDVARHAAMTVLVEALLNYDECITKR